MWHVVNFGDKTIIARYTYNCYFYVPVVSSFPVSLQYLLIYYSLYQAEHIIQTFVDKIIPFFIISV